VEEIIKQKDLFIVQLLLKFVEMHSLLYNTQTSDDLADIYVEARSLNIIDTDKLEYLSPDKNNYSTFYAQL